MEKEAHVTLNASGNGKVRIGPERAYERWYATNVALLVSSNAAEPTAEVRLNGSTLLGSTWSGSRDSSVMGVELGPTDFITVEWFDGDNSAIASATVLYDRR